MRAKPYVGVTGFKTLGEIRDIGAAFLESGFEASASHVPMLGYLCSHKRLMEKGISGTQAPAAKDLPLLTSIADRAVLPMIHYSTQEKDTLAGQVEDLFSLGGMYAYGHCRALQLNMVWPLPAQVELIKSAYPQMSIVLQLPKDATDRIDESANRCQEYASLIDYVLIDPSGGKGMELDVRKTIDMMCALRDNIPSAMIAVAGGLDGGNACGLITLIRQGYDSPFCVDAQGRLRTGSKDGLDLAAAQHYIRACASAIL